MVKMFFLKKYTGFVEVTVESDRENKKLAWQKQTIRQVSGRPRYLSDNLIKPLGRVSLGLLQRGV